MDSNKTVGASEKPTVKPKNTTVKPKKRTVKPGKTADKTAKPSGKRTKNKFVAPDASKQLTPPKLMLLITVVHREKADLYLALLQQFETNLQLSMAATGTATKEMRQYLGIGNPEKSVIFSVMREDAAENALKYLEEKFRTVKNGHGIAFTVPLSSVIGAAVYQFLINDR